MYTISLHYRKRWGLPNCTLYHYINGKDGAFKTGFYTTTLEEKVRPPIYILYHYITGKVRASKVTFLHHNITKERWGLQNCILYQYINASDCVTLHSSKQTMLLDAHI